VKRGKPISRKEKRALILAQPAEFEEGKTVQEALVGKIATIGENLSIRRFARFESEGLVAKYIHGDGKIAVLVNMAKGTEEVAKDICMQIAAARPEYVKQDEVPAERVAKEMEILKIQTMNEGKPEAIAEKIVQGRIGKFYEEICLVDQPFVKDPNKKVSHQEEQSRNGKRRRCGYEGNALYHALILTVDFVQRSCRSWFLLGCQLCTRHCAVTGNAEAVQP